MSWWSNVQTFHLWGPRDYFRKLEWEVAELAKTPKRDVFVLGYRAINCATTAWHMCDWVFAECERDADVRSRLANIAHREIATLGDVQVWARTERPLAICRIIATAGKHFEVTRHPDPTVKATFKIEDDGLPGGELMIYDGDDVHRPHDVFVRALLFWKLALGWLEIR